eukprot:EG_transcript_19381
MSSPLADRFPFLLGTPRGNHAREAIESEFSPLIHLHGFIIRSPLLCEYGVESPGELEQKVRSVSFEVERGYRGLVALVHDLESRAIRAENRAVLLEGMLPKRRRNGNHLCIRAQNARRTTLLQAVLELEALGLGLAHVFDAAERRNFLRQPEGEGTPRKPRGEATPATTPRTPEATPQKPRNDVAPRTPVRGRSTPTHLDRSPLGLTGEPRTTII